MSTSTATEGSGDTSLLKQHRALNRLSGCRNGVRALAATIWMESGVHIKAVCDLLGHSSISITGDIYGHTSDNTARATVDVLSDTLGL